MKLETIPHALVTVRVDGQDLQEYEDTADELYVPNIGRKYVEAASGVEFEIAVAVDAGALQPPHLRDSVVVYVHLDGAPVTGRVFDVQNLAFLRQQIEGKPEVVGGRSIMRPFTFAELVTEDRPVKNIKAHNVSQLGEIKVLFRWMRKEGAPVRMPETASQSSLAESEEAGRPLPEKCLKGRAISQSAKLGKAKAVAATPHQRGHYPYGVQPFATFIFKYRSRLDLQIEGVIERSPTPVPLEDRDPETLTADEARELVRRMRARQDDHCPHQEREARSVVYR